ncbi:MAG TPA: zinc ribbon domain-containing protein [Gemmatimonadales bacterium]|nr:zinc ribbon domain-containing protein [Gemmatimonadales bacterium]
MTEVERFFRRLVSTLAATDPARLQGPLPLDDITGSILPYRTNRRALQVDTVEDYEAVLLRLCAGEGDLVRTEPEEARARFVQESRSPNPDLTALYSFEEVRLTLQPEPLLWALAPDPRADYQAPARTPAASHEYEPRFGTEPELESGREWELVSDHGRAQATGREIEPEPAPEPPAAAEAQAERGAEAERRAERDVAAEREEEPLAEPEPTFVLGAAPRVVPPGLGGLGLGAGDAPDPKPDCPYCGGSLPTNRPVNFCPHCGQSQTQILCPECRSEVEPGWRHCVNCGAAVGEA